ncbi:hypothetical protein N9Y42_01525 [Mariniblastus sp.]|nr:hypothetical protein [Mariniblastus sp.]
MLRSNRSAGIGLSLLWALYAMEQFFQASHPFFIANGKFLNFGIVAVAMFGLVAAIARGKIKKLVITRAHTWWILLMILTSISVAWSVDPSESFSKLKAAAPYIFGFAVIGPLCAFDDVQMDRAFRYTIWLGAVVLPGLIFTGFGARSVVLAYDSVTGRDIEGNPLAVGSFAGYVVVACAFSIYARKVNIFEFAYKGALAILALYVIVRTGSRGQLIGLVLSCMFWLPLTMKMALKKSTLIPLIGAGLLFTVAVLFIGQQTDLAWRWKSERLSNDQTGRLERAQDLIVENFETGPLAWIGGLGSSSSYQLVGGYPHFVPGEVLGEEGIAGFLLFFGFLGSAGYAGWKTINLPSLEKATRVNMGALLTLFSYQFMLCLKQGSLIGSPELFSVGLCIALTARGAKIRARDKYNRQMLTLQQMHFANQRMAGN